MAAGGIAGELEWWRAHRAAADADPAVLRDLLEQFRAWKARHDQDRARQAGPFLLMAWDGVFGDDDEKVTTAIQELEAALAAA